MKIFLIGLMLTVIDIVANGIAGKLCWNWFVPEVYPAAPRLTFTTAVGLMIVCSLYTISGRTIDYVHSTKKEQVYQSIRNSITHGCARPLMILLLSWGMHRLLF